MLKAGPQIIIILLTIWTLALLPQYKAKQYDGVRRYLRSINMTVLSNQDAATFDAMANNTVNYSGNRRNLGSINMTAVPANNNATYIDRGRSMGSNSTMAVLPSSPGTIGTIDVTAIKIISTHNGSVNGSAPNMGKPVVPASQRGAKTADMAILPLARNQFPLFVPRYDVRRDLRTNEEVQRGRKGRASLHDRLWDTTGSGPRPASGVAQHPSRASHANPLSHIDHTELLKPDRVSLIDFASDYQCAPNEPDLDDQNGAISMLRMAPPTMQAVEWVAAYAETRCAHTGKFSCQQHVEDFKKGKYPEKFGVYDNRFNSFEQVNANGNSLSHIFSSPSSCPYHFHFPTPLIVSQPSLSLSSPCPVLTPPYW